MNLLHDIPPGTQDRINVIIEINKGSKNKYEIDKKTGVIALDRVAHTAQDFPYDYGFIPQTLWDDGDAVDVVLLTTYPLLPGILVRVRPIALLHMTDSGDADDKIIAVPADDPVAGEPSSIFFDVRMAVLPSDPHLVNLKVTNSAGESTYVPTSVDGTKVAGASPGARPLKWRE
jgi:inorganic pyrophosphatase